MKIDPIALTYMVAYGPVLIFGLYALRAWVNRPNEWGLHAINAAVLTAWLSPVPEANTETRLAVGLVAGLLLLAVQLSVRHVSQWLGRADNERQKVS